MCFKGLKTFSVGKSGCCFPAEAQMLYHGTAVTTTVSRRYTRTFLFNLVCFFLLQKTTSQLASQPLTWARS